MDHGYYMEKALRLAAFGLGRTRPNPIVGALVVDNSGNILGEGFHHGNTHAEILAMNSTAKSLDGCTLYLTLEPCNHFGKTPPCTDAIIDSAIKRVVIAQRDPNPLATGGVEKLRAAGIEVIENIGTVEAAWVNRAWLHKIAQGRPYFIWKIASTLDGFIAAQDGTSQWITGLEARRDSHLGRAQSDCVLIGTGTAIADDPSLLPHLIEGAPTPLRVVAGERDLPATLKLMSDGFETLVIPSRRIPDLLAALTAEGVNQVLVEAGSGLGSSLLKENLIDEIWLYQAPILLGSGLRAIANLGVTTLNQARAWEYVSVEKIGNDMKSILIPAKEIHTSKIPNKERVRV